MEQVDLLTIGAGGGGYPAAFRLAKAGKQAVMVDTKGIMSGNCLEQGCVPSKTIREAIEVYRLAKKREYFGLKGDNIGFDYSKIIEFKDNVQKFRYEQHAKELEEAKKNLKLLKGVASFIDEHIVKITTENGEKIYNAKNIIIASGAEPSILPIDGAEYCITSTDLYILNTKIKTLPKSIAILGAGYIGVETASFFSELGVNVTIIQRSKRILTSMEERFALLLQNLLNPKIKLEFETEIKKVEKSNESSDYKVSYIKDGKLKTINAELVLMGTGRKPVTPEGIEKIGIELDAKGKIKIKNSIQTNIPHIYASGDVNGVQMLFHSAERQSLVCANNIFAGNTPIDYMNFNAVPTTVFTFPKAAYAGILPSKAASMGIDILETSYDFIVDSKAQIYNELNGEIREFFDAKTMKIIGAWVIGIDAELLIGELVTAIQNSLDVHTMASLPNQHPTSSEGIAKAARKLL
ncbi:MAG: dihydrolipoyl dehydrogenase [Candidatus Acididesulfobacter diazotrophicus]|uniref:Dihydrolipoyl dehydrogenase n=1 Tax=Candidatus Acididesulfobacter diazotrophicus TaxID=2597226 RepID=A0A519BKP6_9DELT|nr:MAG: dihydrolipoyl dehydrogenase [Candidatus Acididesulfobacter diazotrophicus]